MDGETSPKNVIDFKDEQERNAPGPIVVMFSGIVIDTMDVQDENELSPMEVTLVGIFNEVNEVQEENALDPIEMTLLGMMMDVRAVQPRNALVPILSIPLPIVTDLREVQEENDMGSIKVMPSPIVRLVQSTKVFLKTNEKLHEVVTFTEVIGQEINTSFPRMTLPGMVMDFNCVQLEKARSPMDMRLFGKTMEVKKVKEENALFPIVLTPSLMITEVTAVQYEKTLAKPKEMLHEIVTVVNAVHELNAQLPIDVTLLGMNTVISDVQ
jgi:hypothetical protein